MANRTLRNAGLNRTHRPTLFGLTGKSNRETGTKTFWGKNEFNSCFPAALLCYMARKNVRPVYLKLDKRLQIVHQTIGVPELFGMDPFSPDIYFTFEDLFEPHQEFVRGQAPRCDLVIRNTANKSAAVRGFEMKLTALPDNSTAKFDDAKYSCEMVIRPPSVVHLAVDIAYIFKDRRKELLDRLAPVCMRIYNWRNAEEVTGHTSDLIKALDHVFLDLIEYQEPFIIQPIWKTVGKASILHNNCLDVFVWSTFAFTRLFIDEYKTPENGDQDNDEEQTDEKEAKKKNAKKKNAQHKTHKMTRPQRCIFWLARMLYEFSQGGQINPSMIPNEMGYEYQTDKAFSINGMRSWKYLTDKALKKPRVKKTQIRHIILNGGQGQLSPERRFDAAIVNTPGIFK